MTGRCALGDWLRQPIRLLQSGFERVGRLVGTTDGASVEPPGDTQTKTNELLEALVSAQLRTTELIGTLGTASKSDTPQDLRDQIEALRREVELLTLANAPTHARLEDLADAIVELKESLRAAPFAALEQRLHQAVVAQERTNQLLEFALRAGFEEDERSRGV